MLRTDLPQIITETLPGPKALAGRAVRTDLRCEQTLSVQPNHEFANRIGEDIEQI